MDTRDVALGRDTQHPDTPGVDVHHVFIEGEGIDRGMGEGPVSTIGGLQERHLVLPDLLGNVCPQLHELVQIAGAGLLKLGIRRDVSDIGLLVGLDHQRHTPVH